MQRIFSTFPNSWPGAGLLLLRVAAGLPLVVSAAPALLATWGSADSAVDGIRLASGFLLVAGLWTPFAAGAQATLAAVAALSGGAVVIPHLVSGAIGLSLVMLGPGAWSVDARLFGRRQIDVDLD